jgi:hypothetical protein
MNPDQKFNYLILDGSNFYHRCYHIGSLQSTLNSKSLGSNVIGTALKLLDQLESTFAYQESKLYFLFDNSQSQINIRKDIDPNYKSIRDKQLRDKEVFRLHNIFIEILKVKSDNYNILMAGSLEADDLVKPLIQNLNISNQNTVLLLSNDLDWSRSVSDYVSWFDWMQVYNRSEFYSKFGFFPNEESVKIYKSIRGDSADNIPVGCKYVSDEQLKTICEKAYDFKGFQDFVEYVDQIKNENLRLKFKDSMRRLRKNYDLVSFVPIDISIGAYVRQSKLEPLSYRFYLKGLDLPIPDRLKTESETAESFFD